MQYSCVFLSILCPPLGLPLGAIGLCRDFKNWRKYIFCLALCVASFAYAYVPTTGSDLLRYMDNFAEFSAKSFRDAILYTGKTTDGRGAGLVVLYAFYWLMGRIGDYHLASALTTGVIYYVAYYITCDYGERIQSSRKEILAYLAFITLALNFNGIANNIRNIFSFALIGLAVYRDCCQKKRNVWTLLLYVIPIFFHTSSILFLGLRFLIILPRLGRIIASVGLVLSSTILDILFHNLSKIGHGVLQDLLVYAIRKGRGFFFNKTSEWGMMAQSSISLRLLKLANISLAVVLCLCALAILVREKKNESLQTKAERGYRRFMVFDYYSGLLTIACLPMMAPEFWRFGSALIMFGASIYLTARKREKRDPIRVLALSIFAIMPLCTLVWVRRLVASAVISEFLWRPFVSSPILVAFKILSKIFTI